MGVPIGVRQSHGEHVRVSSPPDAQVARPTRATRRTAAGVPQSDCIPAPQPSSLSEDGTTCAHSHRRASAERRTSQHKHERAPPTQARAQPRRRARPRSRAADLGGTWSQAKKHKHANLPEILKNFYAWHFYLRITHREALKNIYAALLLTWTSAKKEEVCTFT